MTQAIIFDCFGVLTTDELLPFLHAHFDYDPVVFDTANEMSKRVDAGAMDYDHFIAALAEMTAMDASVVKQQINANVPNTALFAYITSTLKPQYKIGLLSNAGRDWLAELFTPAQCAIFDAVGLSFELGANKPDPRSYKAIATRLGVLPEESIFIDDLAKHVAGAQEVGMKAIQYVSLSQLRNAIQAVEEGEAYGA